MEYDKQRMKLLDISNQAHREENDDAYQFIHLLKLYQDRDKLEPKDEEHFARVLGTFDSLCNEKALAQEEELAYFSFYVSNYIYIYIYSSKNL